MGYWRLLFEEFLAKGWTNDLEPLLLIANNTSKFLSDRAEAARLIYRYASDETSKNWKVIAQSVLMELLERKDSSVQERATLIHIANSCGLEIPAKKCVEELASIRDLKVEDRRALAKLLSECGDKKRATEILNQIDEADEKASFLGSWDETVIKELQGEEHLKHVRALRVFNEHEPIIDRLLDARDMVSEYGNRRALQLIFDAAYDDHLDPSDRLQAIEVMYELGYRDIPLKLLPGILAHSEVDDYWAADVLLSFGNKAGALERLRKAISTCPESYRDQIACRLADLQAVALLEELKTATTEATV